MPFFVENQSGTKIYVIDGVLGFEIKHTPPQAAGEQDIYTIYAHMPDGVRMFARYSSSLEARRELDGLVNAMVKGESRFSFCLRRISASWQSV